MANELLDILVAGIGGAAGTRSAQLGEEITMLRKHSLAQLTARNKPKEYKQYQLEAQGQLDYFFNQGMITEEAYEVAMENPDIAVRIASNPLLSGAASAGKSYGEESTGQVLGLRELLGRGEAAQSNARSQNTLSEKRDVANSLYETLKAQGANLPSKDKLDLRSEDGVNNFFNLPQVKAMVSTLDEGLQLQYEELFNVPESRGRAAGKEEISRVETLAGAGLREQDRFGPSTTFNEVRDEFYTTLGADNRDDVFWSSQQSGATQAAKDTLDLYLDKRYNEIQEENPTWGEKRIKNQISKEAVQLKKLNIPRLFQDMNIPQSERKDSNELYDRSKVPAKLRQIETYIQTGELPELGSVDTSREPGAGDNVVRDPTIDQPQFLRGGTQDTGGPRTNSDGTVELAPGKMGSPSEAVQTAEVYIRKYFSQEGGDPSGLQKARQIIATNTTPQDRNGKSVDEYLRELMFNLVNRGS